MAHQIIWLPQAEKRFEEIIDYLQKHWTEREIVTFITITNKVLLSISRHPRLYRRSAKNNIHEALITKHNLLLYRVKRNNIIELLTFFDTRQHPKKKFRK